MFTMGFKTAMKDKVRGSRYLADKENLSAK